MTQTADIVICGSGSAGIAAAYYLAQHAQIERVILVDKFPPLTQTSAKSGENIRNWWPNEVMVNFTNRSLGLMEGLANQSNNQFQLVRRGYAYVTTDSAFDVDHYLNPYRGLNTGPIRHHASGSSARSEPYQPASSGPYTIQPDGADIILDSAIIQQAFPHFSTETQAIIHARKCGSVSAQQLGMYLLEAAQQSGLQTLRGEVFDIETDTHGVSAVRVATDAGNLSIETRFFVNAAGPFAPQIAAMLQVDLPIINVFQQKIAFQDHLGIVPRDAPFSILLDRQYLPWTTAEKQDLSSEPGLHWLLDEFPGGLHIKPEGGADSPWLKLGWAFNAQPEAPVWEPNVMAEYPDIVLRGATKLVPGLTTYINRLPQPVRHYGGYYTKTKENLPLIGPLPIKGAYILGALSGFGTMASCAAGELLASWIIDSKKPDYAGFLSLDRYDNPAHADLLKQISGQGEL